MTMSEDDFKVVIRLDMTVWLIVQSRQYFWYSGVEGNQGSA